MPNSEHSAERDVAYLHVGDCDRCGSTTAPTRVVTRLTGERLTICTDAFGCWEREQTRVTPPERGDDAESPTA